MSEHPRHRLVLARVREGTEVLRTGGGVTLSSAECNVLLVGHAALEAENANLRAALERIAEPDVVGGVRSAHSSQEIARAALAAAPPAAEGPYKATVLREFGRPPFPPAAEEKA